MPSTAIDPTSQVLPVERARITVALSTLTTAGARERSVKLGGSKGLPSPLRNVTGTVIVVPRSIANNRVPAPTLNVGGGGGATGPRSPHPTISTAAANARTPALLGKH